MRISSFVQAILRVVVALSCIASLKCQVIRKPNVLVLLVDDLGIADLACFGNDTARTPHIDRLAAGGAKLLHNLAPDSICTPSRAAFLTGRYPIRSGFAANPGKHRVFLDASAAGGLPENETTFAEVLSESGYTTGLIGKWHLGLSSVQADDFLHHPLKHGFHSYYGLPLTNLRDCGGPGASISEHAYPRIIARPELTLSAALCFIAMAMALYKFGFISKLFLAVVIIATVVLSGYIIFRASLRFWLFSCFLMRDYDVVEQPLQLENLTVKFTNEAIDFLHKNNQGPFLLFMAFLKVHTALFTSKPFRNHSGHSEFVDNVEELDWSVGQIMDTLEALGLKENTLVYLTSDNGPHLEEVSKTGQYDGGWKGIYKGGKGQSWEGGIRVPTIVSWPSQIPPGVVITEPTSSMDLFSMILRILGHTGLNDRAIDGKDILPLLTQKSQISPHKFLFHYCAKSIHAVRYRPENGDTIWKAHYITPKWTPVGTEACFGYGLCHCYGDDVDVQSPPLLYDITKDPSEKSPLDPNSSEYKGIMELINAAVNEHKLGVHQVPNQLDGTGFHRHLVQCCASPFCTCTEPSREFKTYP